jgi:hypothetical protein
MPSTTRRAAALLICCAALSVALTAVGAAGLTPASAATPPAWPASVPVPPAPDCADQGGGMPLMPSSAELLPGGGYAYDYIIDGVDNQYIVPPPSFSPLTATAAQLAEYGFPAAPATASLRSEWESAMASYSSVPPPSFCQTGFRSPAIPVSGQAPTGSSQTFANWSGYAARSKSNAWIAVEGEWTENKLGNCHCTLPAYVTTWAGLGADPGYSLLQAGAQASDTASGKTYFAWYEYLKKCGNTSCGPSEISVGTIRAGDQVYTQTSYETSSHTANFFVEANGKSFPIKPKKLSSAYYSGMSAEWIAEKPAFSITVSGTKYLELYPLGAFGTYQWQEAYAETTGGSYKSVASLSPWTVIMNGYITSKKRATLAEPAGKPSGAGFGEKWIRAGIAEYIKE